MARWLRPGGLWHTVRTGLSRDSDHARYRPHARFVACLHRLECARAWSWPRRSATRHAGAVRFLPDVVVVVAQLLRHAPGRTGTMRPARLRLRAARSMAAIPQRQLAAAMP